MKEISYKKSKIAHLDISICNYNHIRSSAIEKELPTKINIKKLVYQIPKIYHMDIPMSTFGGPDNMTNDGGMQNGGS